MRTLLRPCGNRSFKGPQKLAPAKMYRYANVNSTVLESGDVYARAKLRSLEIEQSIGFILEQLENLPAPKPKDREKNLRPDAIVVSFTEGHRGEIAHAC